MMRYRHRTKKFRKIKHLRRQRSRGRLFYQDYKSTPTTLPKIVVLTGAGISAESGIRTFRSSDGLWEEHRVEDVATPEGFARDPLLVQNFYNDRRRQLQQPDIQPNPAHYALAELEKVLGDNFLLVTQNIDNLHEQAGNQRIIHMHGELLKVRCCGSNQVLSWKGDLSVDDKCHCCQFLSLCAPMLSGSAKCLLVWIRFITLWNKPIYLLRLGHRDMYILRQDSSTKPSSMVRIR